MADGLSDQKIAEWEETLEPYALDPCVAHWEETLETATDRTDFDAAEAALEGRARGVGEDPLVQRARGVGAGAAPAEGRRRPRPDGEERGAAKRPRAEGGGGAAGRAAPRRARAAALVKARRAAAPHALGDLNRDVDPALLSEENASRIVLGMAALLEFMMEEAGGGGRQRAPSQLAVFACGDGGARPTLTNLHAFLNDMARLCHYTLECNVVALILLIRFFSYQKNLRLAPARRGAATSSAR
ncbi:Cyclin-dependent protein kinase [Aureococcus anophagefferens]|uniref:Cyclin-dependent protein kinase n=1 Tax=Aureococcus anophagefferens TaxID=44056 RepID=A0ABR1G5S7_AURAN